MDIKKTIKIKNDIETIVGIIVGIIFGAKFISILSSYMAHYTSSGIHTASGIYAPLIAIITGVIIFFGIRSLAYLLSSIFLGTGIGVALFDLTGVDILTYMLKVFAILNLNKIFFNAVPVINQIIMYNFHP